jgi:rhodanese-related sulfurtransferase
VLPPVEFEGEYIEGAVNIPLKDLDEETTSVLDRDRAVIVY